MSERRGTKKVKGWEPQFYPGYGFVAERRRKVVDRNRRLVKLRNIPDDDIVRLLGHRAPGGLYLSLHPPLDGEIRRPHINRNGWIDRYLDSIYTIHSVTIET